ncbi:hypothetical protein BUALT_Bualt08G0059800 [Buddleja alternifolia]|uniref:Cytochrome P450 n=1 Tax=Buddleja alternifolia TaxID=168488 RepID=A0AAV6X5K3_9LAMI|nr:hypothetical protein BUALT_Bualt08G0059800 [Buddleja alternifolia]
MELNLSPWLTAFATLLITFSFYFYSKSKKENRKNLSKKFPLEASGGWPIIGHLFLLSGPEPLHLTLSNMSDKYGPVFGIRLGNRRGLIVNTWETAKEVYKTNDAALSYRPQNAALRLMGYNFATVGFSNDALYWREIRKVSVLKFLSKRKVAMHGDVRKREIMQAIRSVNECYYIKKVDIIDMRKVFWDFTVNLMARTVAGDVSAEKMGSEERGKWQEIVREFFKTMIVFTISDVVPWLKWVDYFGGMHHNGFKETGKSFDDMLEAWLEEHKEQKKKVRGDGEEELEEDFMGELLSVADCVAHKFPVFDADTITKATCQVSGFALSAMQLALASFLHGFDIETASGEAVDMTGSFGSTNMKATPLEVCLRPRLSYELYV